MRGGGVNSCIFSDKLFEILGIPTSDGVMFPSLGVQLVLRFVTAFGVLKGKRSLFIGHITSEAI